MNDTKDLALRLPELSDDDLVDLLIRAGLPEASMGDFFELADALLSDATIRRMLTSEPRQSILALHDAAASPPGCATASTLLFFRQQGGPREPVARFLASDHAASIRERLAQPEPQHPSSGTDTALSVEDGLHAVLVLMELLMRRDGVSLTARGTLTVAESQRITEIVPVDVRAVHSIVSFAQDTGLAVKVGGVLRITESGHHWIRLSMRERWIGLSVLWRESLSEPVRRVLRTHSELEWHTAVPARVRWDYPAVEDSALDSAREYAHTLGILVGDRPTRAARALFAAEDTELREIVREALPEEISSTFVQHDMTVVAPGVLRHADEEFVHRIADVEQRSYASRYRLSERSIMRGIEDGMSANHIAAELLRLSGGAIPQPLEYILSRAPREGVHASRAARAPWPDPVMLAPRRHSVLAAVTAMRNSAGDPATEWRERQLRDAIRTKEVVQITVRLPDGTETEYVLQPAAISSGRLRGRDTRADVERTLPVALIVDVRAL